MLAIGPDFADAALICKGGHLHYGGSGFYSNRLEAEASAIQACAASRRLPMAQTRVAKIFPDAKQLHCARAMTRDGWRCFVRGGPCRAT